MAGPDNSSIDPAEAERFDLLIRLLKLGSFINTPMKAGVCDPAGISQIELKVIMALSGEGALAGHELVALTGVAPMNVSRAIAALCERGLVEHAADPENRRRKPVRLTAAGHAAYARIAPLIGGLADSLLGGLTARQRRESAAAADRIIAAMAGWIADNDAY
jgi:DNA-binding MarR family transcriptional regulator